LSGTGKSQLARALAPELGPAPGAIVLRSDVERKALAGIGETEHLPAAAYSAEGARRVYAALAEKARRVVAAGHAAVIDAVFSRAGERDALRSVAHSAGVAFHALFLTADLAARLRRIGSRRADASDAGETVAREQERYAAGPNDWAAVDASGTPAETLERARRHLDEHLDRRLDKPLA